MSTKHVFPFSGIFRLRPLACMLLMMVFGCEATQSIEEMPQGLEDVGTLKTPLEQVGELKTPLEQVAALKTPLEQVATLDAPLNNVAELKEPLTAVGALTTITQPSTYVPMFGFIGIVLFLAIWGGMKLGRR